MFMPGTDIVVLVSFFLLLVNNLKTSLLSPSVSMVTVTFIGSLKGFLKWMVDEKSLFRPTETTLSLNFVGGIP